MKRSKSNMIATAAVVLSAVTGVVAAPTPAHASQAATAFTGVATVNPALWFPPGPVRNGTWSVSVNGPAASSIPTAAGVVFNATMGASGYLHGGIVAPFGGGALCGLSGGSGGQGSANLAPLGPANLPLSNVNWVQSAATLVPFTGTTPGGGTLAGVASAIPPVPNLLGSGSCSLGTATTFTVVGTAALTF